MLKCFRVVLARLFEGIVREADVTELSLKQRAVIPGIAEADALGCSVL